MKRQRSDPPTRWKSNRRVAGKRFSAAGPRGQQSFAKRLLAGLKKRAGPELKTLDTFFANAAVTGNVMTPVHNIAQGPDQDKRIGNHIRAKSLFIKLLVGQNNAEDVQMDIVRVIVLVDTQQIGDTDINEANVLAFTSYPLVSPVHRTVTDRYVILADQLLTREHVLPQSSASTEQANQNSTMYWDRYIRLDHDIAYNGAASTGIQNGCIYVMILNAENTVAAVWPESTQSVKMQAWYRLRYTDQ